MNLRAVPEVILIQPLSFKRYRFPPESIRYAVWAYFRFTMSLCNGEDLMAQRGIEVSYGYRQVKGTIIRIREIFPRWEISRVEATAILLGFLTLESLKFSGKPREKT